MASAIKVFRKFPRELFRVNNGLEVKVRTQQSSRHVYDIVTQDGWVRPLALEPDTYQAPNGASMRPNSPYQQYLLRHLFKGEDIIVYSIPEGTELPKDLLLVHERSDHYSLQPAEKMTVDDLNSKITSFFYQTGKVYEKLAWMRAYPKATEDLQYARRR